MYDSCRSWLLFLTDEWLDCWQLQCGNRDQVRTSKSCPISKFHCVRCKRYLTLVIRASFPQVDGHIDKSRFYSSENSNGSESISIVQIISSFIFQGHLMAVSWWLEVGLTSSDLNNGENVGERETCPHVLRLPFRVCPVPVQQVVPFAWCANW